MSEEHGQTHDDQQKVQRVEHQPAQPAAGLEGLAAQGPAPSYSGSLLGDPRLDGRGNQPVKTAVMRQMQRTYGNRAVQRQLTGHGQNTPQSFGDKAVQRWESARLSLQRSASASTSIIPPSGTEENDASLSVQTMRAFAPLPVQRCGAEVHEGCACAGGHAEQQDQAGKGDSPVAQRQIAPEKETNDQSIVGPSNEFDDQTIQRSPTSTAASAPGRPARRSVQRQGPAEQPPPADNPAGPGGGRSLIVEDSARDVGPGQMKKSAFMTEARAAVERTVEQTMGAAGVVTARSTIDEQFNAYQGKDSQTLERTLHTEVPGAARATTAQEYIPAITDKVRASTSQSGGGGILGAIGGAVSGAVGAVGSAVGNAISGIGNLFFKARDGGPREADDPVAIQAQLGPGQSLNGNVKSGLESVFGQDFSDVRVHTDSKAGDLAGNLNARAFTVGQNIAFGAGEYQPGTLVGDALIAHELAHVVQQKGASSSTDAAAPQAKGDGEYSSLEEDADMSAVGAIASMWGGARGELKNIAQNVAPSMRSGLRLQRCNGNSSQKCCCCVNSVSIGNINRIDNTTHMGHSFDLVASMAYTGNGTKDSCRLEWWEKTNVPAIPGHQPNTWTDMYALYPQSPTFDPWKNRAEPCPGNNSVTIMDPPSLGKRPGRTVTRTLEFRIVVNSGASCNTCGNASKQATATQVLAMVNGAPDWANSSYTTP
ncbi:MAG TPA: DUF4157 domain-containing protein [Chloroflexia bacterium]|nr:DUF4157 domain-containing protein [Chloroflexia bacterium]